jgi:dipeptidyl aminopeptidase/acylaminoacyl peptidase
MTGDHELSTLFALADAEAEPALRPGFTEQTIALARRSVRRRRVGATLAAVVAVLLAGIAPALFATARRGAVPAAPAGRPSLPDHFASYSDVTSTVTRQPAGRAIVYYEYGGNDFSDGLQPLVVGADRDTYRRVDAVEERKSMGYGFPEVLLSPDGTQVLVGGTDREATSLTLVNLTTGGRRDLRVDPPLGIQLLAWSPDGRYVAYGDAPVGSPNDVNKLATTELVILDLATGTSTHYPQIQAAPAIRSASFAPDSRRLAVQLGAEAWIVTIDGQRERQLTLPAGQELLMRYAWLPGGTLIATTAYSYASGVPHPDGGKLVFINADGSDRQVPAPVSVGGVLGWISSTRLVTFEADERSVGGSIVETDLGTGELRTLSRFNRAERCAYGLSDCVATDLQLATGLLGTLDTRAAGPPDRGPRPIWMWIVGGLIATFVLGGIGAALQLRRWRNRRREASSDLQRTAR